MVQRTLLNLLRLLGTRAPMVRGPYCICVLLLGPKPERRRALLFSLGFFIFYLFLSTIPRLYIAFLGGLTWSKTRGS